MVGKGVFVFVHTVITATRSGVCGQEIPMIKSRDSETERKNVRIQGKVLYVCMLPAYHSTKSSASLSGNNTIMSRMTHKQEINNRKDQRYNEKEMLEIE